MAGVGVELATAWVRLVPTMTGVQSAIGKQLAPASAIADAEGKRAGKRFATGFNLNIKTLAAGAIGLAAVKFVKDSIDAVQEWQVINSQTAAVVKSTGGAAKITAKEVHKLAESIEGVTATQGEAIQKGANMLLTFKNIRNEAGKGNDIFNQSTRVLIDMARAMGTEPQTAAIQLGKALNDPVAGISALSRVGIQFTEDQKKVITSLVEAGDTMGAQKIILAELQSQFGGSGAGYAETFSGKMFLIQDAIGDIGEKIITMAMPHLTDMANWILDHGIPALEQFHDWVVQNKDVLGPTAIAIGGVTGAMWLLNFAMNANPVVLFTSALIGLIAWFGVVISDTQHWQNVMTDAAKAFADRWKITLTDIGRFFSDFGKNIVGFFAHLAVPIVVFGQTVQRTVSTAFMVVTNIARSSLNSIIDLVNGVIGRLNSVSGALKSVTGGAINLTIGRIPRLAHGGIVMPSPGGSLVNVAEAGKPEAIIPLDQWKKMLDVDFPDVDGETTVTNNWNITTPPNEDPRVVARGLAREFSDQIAGRRR